MGSPGMTEPSDIPLSLRRAVRVCVLAVLASIAAAALLAGAVLLPVPPPVLPLVLLVVIGLPLGAADKLPIALRVLRAPDRLRRGHLHALRRQLAQLPETRHPLGL